MAHHSVGVRDEWYASPEKSFYRTSEISNVNTRHLFCLLYKHYYYPYIHTIYIIYIHTITRHLFCLLYKHYYYPFPNMLRGSVFYWPRVRQKISKLSKLSTVQKSNCRRPTTTRYIQMKMFSSHIITNKDGWKNVLNLLLRRLLIGWYFYT